MFNILVTIPYLITVTCSSFFIIFLFRHAFLKRNGSIILFHIILFLSLYMASIVGGNVQNEGYKNLKAFMELEKKGKLENAKQNLEKCESMLAIDLTAFKNSSDFKVFLKNRDDFVDDAEAVSVAWIFVFLSDIAMVIIFIVRNRENKKRVI